MVCLICRESIGFFTSKRSCSASHEVHSKCLKSGVFSFDIFKDCRSCILEILKNVNQVTHCLVCRSVLGESLINCEYYRNLCVGCTTSILERRHYIGCKICRSLHQNSIRECHSCGQFIPKTLVFTTPKCSVHYFCKSCINKPHQGKLCDNCNLYFKILQQQDNTRLLICNVCGKYPDGCSIICKAGHSYCKDCLVLSTTKDITIYYRVNRCTACLDLLKLIQFDDSGRIYLNEIENRGNPERGNQDIEEGKIVFDQPVTKKIMNNVVVRGNSDFMVQPRVEEIKNYIYNNPIQTLPERKILNPKPSQPEIKDLLPEKKHEGEEYGKINHAQVAPQKNIPRIFTVCSLCGNPEGYKFSCSHSYCFSCLYLIYLENFNSALILIQSGNIKSLKESFQVRCTSNGCGTLIRVPLDFISQNIVKQVPEDLRIIMHEFLPYFDGIKTKFTICNCGRCIGKIGMITLNCKC